MSAHAHAPRRCACGGLVGPTGECAACRSRRIAAERRDGPKTGPQPPQAGAQPAGHDFGRMRVNAEKP